MASSWCSVVIDAHDIRAQGAFWAAVLNWRVDVEGNELCVLSAR